MWKVQYFLELHPVSEEEIKEDIFRHLKVKFDCIQVRALVTQDKMWSSYYKSWETIVLQQPKHNKTTIQTK